MRSLAFALFVAALPALAVEPPGPMVIATSPELYIEIVHVTGGQPETGQLIYEWGPHASGFYDTAVSQAVRTLKSPRFEGCLSAIARTRAGLYEDLLRLTPTAYPDTRNAVLRRARGVWIEYGAHLALQEAAEKGTAGPDTRAFFDRCDALLRGSDHNKL